jgi:type II secretory pathway component PulF
MSLFSPRIGLKPLARLCRQLSTSLAAGIDVRKVWQRETERAFGARKAKFQQISMSVAAGESMAAALAKTGDFFPDIFRELSEVGEQSGRLAEVYRQMAEHYDHQLELRRQFLKAISWPMIQLTAAIFIVGIFIYVMGIIATMNPGPPVDLLGLGLMGGRGVVIYLAYVGAAAAVLFLSIQAIRRGGPWSGPLQLVLWRVPVLGKALKTLALSRFSWSFYMTSEAGMDLRKAIPLSLRSTRSIELMRQSDGIVTAIQHGREVHEALREARVFPLEYLDAIEVGEHSGQLVETLALLTREQEDSARSAFGVLTTVAGFAVWCTVAALITAIIFRVFTMYMGLLDRAMH